MKKTFKTGLFDQSLFVDGRDSAGHGSFRGFAEACVVSLRPALDGIYKSRGSGTKVERSESSTVGGFEQRLILGGGEEVLMRAVSVLVQQLDVGYESGGGLAVGDGFGAN